MGKAYVSLTGVTDNAPWLAVRMMKLPCPAQQEVAATVRLIAQLLG